jgi:hypothetical protein
VLVREERILADRKLAKAGGQVDELLGACWEETLEAGPYDFGDKVIYWGKVQGATEFRHVLPLCRPADMAPGSCHQIAVAAPLPCRRTSGPCWLPMPSAVNAGDHAALW